MHSLTLADICRTILSTDLERSLASTIAIVHLASGFRTISGLDAPKIEGRLKSGSQKLMQQQPNRHSSQPLTFRLAEARLYQQPSPMSNADRRHTNLR